MPIVSSWSCSSCVLLTYSMPSLYLRVEMGQPPVPILGSDAAHTMMTPQLACDAVPHVWPATEHAVPSVGQGAPESVWSPAS